jgi:hypothetical protein
MPYPSWSDPVFCTIHHLRCHHYTVQDRQRERLRAVEMRKKTPCRIGTKGPVIRARLGDLTSGGRVLADMMIMIDVTAIVIVLGTGLGIEIGRGRETETEIEIGTGKEDMIVGEMTETATEIETGIGIGIDVDMTSRLLDVALLHLIDIENLLFQLVTPIQTRLEDHPPQAQRPKRRSRD